MIMELAWWKSAMWVSRLEPQQSWWYRWSLLFGEASLFVHSGFLLIGWDPPTFMEGSLFYSEFPDSNVSLNKNTIQVDTQD